MMRTQIQLPEDDYHRIRDLARRRGISLAEMIRRCVSDKLAEERVAPTREERVAAALAICGKYEDHACSNVAEHHDDYLVEALMSPTRDV